jgi:hypothetical protein
MLVGGVMAIALRSIFLRVSLTNPKVSDSCQMLKPFCWRSRSSFCVVLIQRAIDFLTLNIESTDSCVSIRSLEEGQVDQYVEDSMVKDFRWQRVWVSLSPPH